MLAEGERMGRNISKVGIGDDEAADESELHSLDLSCRWASATGAGGLGGVKICARGTVGSQ